MNNFRFSLFLFFVFAGFAFQVQSQENNTVPMDPKVVVGQLSNGLKYYIRQNGKPEKRAEFWLVVNAGAILENEDQNGLAHFCEHMAFNGTEHFKKHQIIHYLQSIGMKFGPEINAFTNADATNFMLQTVPTDNAASIDTALLILFDWAHLVSYEDVEIDNERGVLHEEWRTRQNASLRLRIKTSQVIYKDSKYANHDVIGKINIIDSCAYETLKSFYRDWYRPDLQAIVAVGDFDPKAMEQKIKDLFSTLPYPANPRPKQDFDIPDNNEPLIAIESDKEAQQSRVTMLFKHNPVKVKDLGYMRNSYASDLISSMMGSRYQEIIQSENPPFASAFSAYTSLTPTKDAYMSSAIAKPGESELALKHLMIENERIFRFGFTLSELERAKIDLLKEIETQFNERNKLKSSNLAWEYYANFLENEPAPGIEFEYSYSKKVIPEISLDEINQMVKNWMTDKNQVITITGPEKEGLKIPKKEEILALLNSYKNEKITAYVDKVSDKPLMEQMPTPTLVTKTVENTELGYTEWTLGNGLKVVLKTTNFKDDEILMNAFSWGGSSIYPATDRPTLLFTESVAASSGIAGFSQVELSKLLTGKQVALNPFIDELNEGFSGKTTPEDFETMLQLVYLYFTQPRFDQTAFNSLMTRYRSVFVNRTNDPNVATNDTFAVTMSNYNPYRQPLNLEYLDKVKFEGMAQMHKDRFADAKDFTFFFVGNIDKEKFKPLIEKYLGGIPSLPRSETWKNINLNPPVQKIEKDVFRPLEVPKSTVIIGFQVKFENTLENRILLNGINDILASRYTETIREEEGGTYGASVRTSFSKYPDETFSMNIKFDCAAEKADKLTGIVLNEIEKIRLNGPTEKDLNDMKMNKIKDRADGLKENGFWVNLLLQNYMNSEGPETVTRYDEMIQGITNEKIKETALKYLDTTKYVKVVLRPQK